MSPDGNVFHRPIIPNPFSIEALALNYATWSIGPSVSAYFLKEDGNASMKAKNWSQAVDRYAFSWPLLKLDVLTT